MILKKGEVIELGKVNFILEKYNKKKLEDVYFEIFGEKWILIEFMVFF